MFTHVQQRSLTWSLDPNDRLKAADVKTNVVKAPEDILQAWDISWERCVMYQIRGLTVSYRQRLFSLIVETILSYLFYAS